MTLPSKKFEFIVWGGLILTILAIVAAFVLSKINAPPPLPVYSQLHDFSMLDQNGQPVSPLTLSGKVCLADVIFTRCPGQCLRMTQHLKELQAMLPAGLPVEFVSISTDPVFDRPPVFKKYIQQFGLNDQHWLFLSGDKPTLKKVAADDMKLTAMDKPVAEQDNINDLFIHSAKLVLIDQLGQVRAYFDGEDLGNNPQIINAIKSLADEK